MNNLEFLSDYFEHYRRVLFQNNVKDKIVKMYDITVETNNRGNKLIFAGNGASSAIASHCALDFTKQARVRAINFNDAALLTAFSNDYGYENWVVKAIEFYTDPGDLIVLISSSGKSPNIVNAAQYAKKEGFEVITFTGFSPDNPLRKLGNLNFWVDSKAYNIVECIHMVLLTTVIDLIVGKAEYSVSQHENYTCDFYLNR